MAQICFASQAIGRVDNPWLSTSLDVRGPDADTLRAHASKAIYDAPLLSGEIDAGMPSARRWIAFAIEGQSFEVRFVKRNFAVEVRLPA